MIGGNNKILSYILMFCFTLSGALSKIDIYTDVAFLVEVYAWDNNSSLGLNIMIISIIVFILSLVYQIWTQFLRWLTDPKVIINYCKLLF